MGNPFGRSNVIPLTNQSGGSVAAGDLVYLDTGHDDSFTTGTTAAYTGAIGIAQQAIGAGSVGLVLVGGYASLVNVNASVTRGHFGQTHTVAKQATDAGASRVAGTCMVFLKGGTTPDAQVWQPDLGGGSGMANPLTTTGDIIYSSSGTTPARLGIGTAWQVLRVNAGATAEEWASGMTLLSDVNLSGGAAASIDFAAIPATGRHLVLEAMVRGAKSAAYDDLHVTLNADGGSHYDYQQSASYQSTSTANESVAQAYWVLGQPAAASATAGLFTYLRVEIPYYADTNFRKSARAAAAEVTAESTGSYLTRTYALHWRSAAAITELTLSFAGGNVAQYSRASLYIVG